MNDIEIRKLAMEWAMTLPPRSGHDVHDLIHAASHIEGYIKHGLPDPEPKASTAELVWPNPKAAK